MKQLLACCIFLASQLNARPVRVTLYNKSTEAIRVSFDAQSSPCEKISLKPRQSKLFPVQDITEMRSGFITIEHGSGYWPAVYELKLLEPAELVLKRDSLVVSRKVLSPHQRRVQKHVAKLASPTIAIKMAYYGKNGCGKQSIAGQEIGFM